MASQMSAVFPVPNIEEVLRANGAEFQGYIAACGRTLILFSDPVSGTTLALETAEFSADAVAARLEESRREYSCARGRV